MTEDTKQMKHNPLQPAPAGPQTESDHIQRIHTQPSMPPLPIKETFSALYQQRQKCELRRLLKHTHPELKTLDGMVDKELAEVLSSENMPTAADTGYEGEVLSRRWIFENCAPSNTVDPHAPKMHMTQGAVQGGDVRRTSALFEQPWKILHEERTMVAVVGPEASPGDFPECEEELVTMDVQSTKRLFESQHRDTKASQEDISQRRVVVSEDERGAVQKRKHVFESCSKQKTQRENKSNICFKNPDVTSQFQKQTLGVTVNGGNTEREVCEVQLSQQVVPRVFERKSTGVSKAEVDDETTQRGSSYTSQSLLENNPFRAINMYETKAQNKKSLSDDLPIDNRAFEDMPMANVRNRAQLFESMPFDRINHQNREEMETMVEGINETLNYLYHVNAIHSHGFIIEAHETGIAKRAKYSITNGRPEIQHDKVDEGGVQNFILQLLARATVKPQVVYLKEDEQANVEVTVVDVPVHQSPFTANQEKEFRTAIVVQLIEDILSQDNSLRKGVMIQENVQGCAEATVYSLYNYAEGEVKRYCPLQGKKTELIVKDTTTGGEIKMETHEVTKGDVRSTISCLLATAQDNTSPASFRPEVNIKGTVKLFRSCIEKGDLEYLKTLQVQPSEEELPNKAELLAGDSTEHLQHQDDQVEQNNTEIVPVDVKKLKNMFSAGGSAYERSVQNKEIIHADIHSTKLSLGQPSQSMLPVEREHGNGSLSTPQQQKNNSLRSDVQVSEKEHDSCEVSQEISFRPETQEDYMVHQAELVEVVEDEDEISNLQTAIYNLQQATIEAKAIHHVTLEKQQFTTQGLSKQQGHVLSGRSGGVKVKKTPKTVEQVPQITVKKEKTCCASIKTSAVPPNMTLEHESEFCKEPSCADMALEEKQTADVCSIESQEGTEVVQRGHLKAAMKSSHSLNKEQYQEEKEEVVRGKLQAALDSLEKSSLNVSKGDFRAAMIYRNSGKSHTESYKNIDMGSVSKPTVIKVGPLTESKSAPSLIISEKEQVATEELKLATAETPSSNQTTNKPDTDSTLENKSQIASVAPTQKNKRPIGPKPAIPPKPDYLKASSGQVKGSITIQSTKTEYCCESQVISMNTTNITKQQKIEEPPQNLLIKPMSYKDALCRGLSQTDSATLSKPRKLDSEKTERRDRNSIESTNELAADVKHYTEEMKLPQEIQTTKVIPHRETSDNYVGKSNTDLPQEGNATKEGESHQSCPEDSGRANETVIGFQAALQNFGGNKEAVAKKTPVKPKRVKMAQSEGENQKHTSEINTSTMLTPTGMRQLISTSQPGNKSNTHEQSSDNSKDKVEMKIENKVVMREKKVKAETEDEQRQRLSVHMDEIMRGNVTTAMEIFNNLRKQEQLQEILTEVEEIEKDTSQVDVRSLRSIFENVPAWVVIPGVKKQHKQNKVDQNVERSESPKDDTESVSSMAHVFGDLERASEEIINLKEQTLARLMDIEETIKKALYSVSTLKSDSDIAGLSGLFKESLGTVQGSPTTSNIRKICIGSSRAKMSQAKENPNTKLQKDRFQSVISEADQILEVPATKPRTSPPSSPCFISIQSAARKKAESSLQTPQPAEGSVCQHSPKPGEKFRSTKIMPCNSRSHDEISDPSKGPGQRQSSCSPCNPLNQRRQVSVLEVQTIPEGNSIIGSQTIRENYEKTDNLGNRSYSSKATTVVSNQPETKTSSWGSVVTSQTRHAVVTYPEVRLPINKKSSPPL